jgi:hypothetical protein
MKQQQTNVAEEERPPLKASPLRVRAREHWTGLSTLALKAREFWLVLLVVTIAVVAFIWVASVYLPPGVDWHDTFRPAALEALHLRNPYSVKGFLNAPWAILPLLPLALLPENVGRAILLLLNLGALAFAARKLGANAFALGAFLISPIVLHGLLNGTIDWMVVLGFVLPPQVGLFFVIIKPQVGAAMALFWLVEAWRKGGWQETLRQFWPVTIALLASFAAFGLWPLRFGQTLDYWWNASLWPLSIPIGLVLLVVSFKKRNARYAMGASPCLSPYVLFHSWVSALISIVALPLETCVAVAGLWVVVIIQAVK